MIVLDTNVISELMKPTPSTRVTDWVSAQPSGTLFTTAINQAEILLGVELLPEGKRHDELAQCVAIMFEPRISRKKFVPSTPAPREISRSAPTPGAANPAATIRSPTTPKLRHCAGLPAAPRSPPVTSGRLVKHPLIAKNRSRQRSLVVMGAISRPAPCRLRSKRMVRCMVETHRGLRRVLGRSTGDFTSISVAATSCYNFSTNRRCTRGSSVSSG